MMTNPLTDGSTYQLFAIIVAGGSGSRMKSDLPKQFLLLDGKPILQRTIEQFLAVQPPQSDGIGSAEFPAFTSSVQIILVLPDRDLSTWQRLCEQHHFYPAVQTVAGGATRFQSVRNGLAAIRAETGLVAVHDGVRPFISPTIIRNSFETAARTGSAVTCVPVNDSIRIVDPSGLSQAVDRSQYRFVQTPQTFDLRLFRQAFQTEEQPFFTDCASVMEYAGFPITLIEGSYQNIKITTPADLRAPGGSLEFS